MSARELYNAKTLAIGTHTTQVVPLKDHRTVHAFDYKITGDGNVTVTPYTSIAGQFYVSNGAKVSAVVETSGPGGDGSDSIAMRLKPADFIYFSVVVAGDAVVLTMNFVQK